MSSKGFCMSQVSWAITGLKQQQELLSNLIQQLESQPQMDDVDAQMYEEVLKGIEKNLKRMRKIGKIGRDKIESSKEETASY